jgi:hypothetical protein
MLGKEAIFKIKLSINGLVSLCFFNAVQKSNLRGLGEVLGRYVVELERWRFGLDLIWNSS